MILLDTRQLKIKKLLVAILLSVVTISHTVGATSGSDFKTTNDIDFYDASGTTGAICSGGGGSLIGESGKEKTWNFLIGKGLSKEQAAGIAGNLSVESGFIPDNQEDSQQFPNGGWGIAQWTSSRRTEISAAVQKAGLPYTNEKTPANLVDKLLLFELNYLWNEANDRGDLDKLRADTAGKTGDAAVSAAAVSWHKYYEISADATPTNRINRSVEIYNQLKDAPAVTTSASAGCGASVADGVTYFSQYDPAWSAKPYGVGASASTIEESGCGPTSMAMVISTLTGKTVTPLDVATWGASYYVPGAGSKHTLFTDAAKNWGLKATTIGKDEASVKNTLSKGGLVVAGGSGALPYTSAGHIIVIRGVTPDGKYLVANPMPAVADQGKSSADVIKNTNWYNTAYSWGQVGSAASAMYAITK